MTPPTLGRPASTPLVTLTRPTPHRIAPPPAGHNRNAPRRTITPARPDPTPGARRRPPSRTG